MLIVDISLFSTTLRYAASNEVATVSNGSLATARITNCARSPNALVVLFLKLHLRFHDDDSAERFRNAVDNYVHDNPEEWDSVVYFRCEEIDTDNEFVLYRLMVRSRHSWQVAPRVLQNRAGLRHFTVQLARKMKVQWESATPRSVTYYGGTLIAGGVTDYKTNLVQQENILASGQKASIVQGHATQPAPETNKTNPGREDYAAPELPPWFSSERQEAARNQVNGDNVEAINQSSDDMFLAMLQQSHEG